jgi:hypothetical protein
MKGYQMGKYKIRVQVEFFVRQTENASKFLNANDAGLLFPLTIRAKSNK